MNIEELLKKLSEIENATIEQQTAIYRGDFEHLDLHKTLALISKLTNKLHDHKNNGGLL